MALARKYAGIFATVHASGKLFAQQMIESDGVNTLSSKRTQPAAIEIVRPSIRAFQAHLRMTKLIFLETPVILRSATRASKDAQSQQPPIGVTL